MGKTLRAHTLVYTHALSLSHTHTQRRGVIQVDTANLQDTAHTHTFMHTNTHSLSHTPEDGGSFKLTPPICKTVPPDTGPTLGTTASTVYTLTPLSHHVHTCVHTYAYTHIAQYKHVTWHIWHYYIHSVHTHSLVPPRPHLCTHVCVYTR